MKLCEKIGSYYRNFTIKYDPEFDDCVKLINEEV